jgi:NDP-mannose synthase
MRAAILAGGKGTRLRPYTTVLPKPLLPIGERPILELIISQLAKAGFTHIDLLVGHLGELIRAYFEEWEGRPADVELHYHWEDEPLGTAGALRNLPQDERPVLVMNGDILTTLDYGELVRYHTEHEAVLTIATHRKQVNLALGVIEDDGEGLVTGYVEKPTLNYEVSMGCYVYSPVAVAHIPAGRFDFPDLVLKLVEAGEPVCGYHFDGAWFDIGTAEEYDLAVDFIEANPGLFNVG